MRNNLIYLVFVALTAVVAPRAAHADDPLAKPNDPEALRHLDRGDVHFRIQEFKEAIEEYRAGARIEPSPRFLYNLAQAFRQLKDSENALWYFQQWINTAKPPEAMRKPIEEVMGKLRDDLAKAASTQPPTDPAQDSDGAGDALASPRWYRDGLGWAITGTGTAAAIGGLLFLLDASSLDKEADGADSIEEERDALRDKAGQRRTLGLVFLGVGGAAAIAGIVRLALTPDGPTVERAPAGKADEGAHLTIGAGWISLQGSF